MNSHQRSKKPSLKTDPGPSVVYFFAIDDTQPSLHSAVFMRLWSFRGVPKGIFPINITREDQEWS
ncbi:hypothetical protein DSCO28_32890 [Desulfosarcina ovata subsp. sediminis]|uniref:Uncharacterized protein n=1 Tax=Desulfosarcina ovata subsp. sediminis TaxID=885957 RepID=A0A5K7ZRT3_9BACT|nr:hypothetical protein [Desulfosarcina ovata]BBO82723.1 hypothetical protein DSCO28_32890 [Desulfosarcina ovata subsp. sediminis]